MKVIRAAVDEMWSVLGQMTSAVFRHGLPLTDKIAARTALIAALKPISPTAPAPIKAGYISRGAHGF